MSDELLTTSDEEPREAEGARRKEIELNRRDFLTATAGMLLAAESIGAHSDSSEAAKLTAAFGRGENMTEKGDGKKLDFLKNYSTTLLESAVSLIKGTHDGISVTRPGLARRWSGTERLVGHAVTSVFSTDAVDARGRRENEDYWNYAFGVAGPKVAVSLDASREPGSGSSWGQLNAHIHQALGCRGVVTNGGVRDIDQFTALGFQVYSAHLTVGHGNPHFIKFGEPVALAGATFHSGDVVCADEHGAIVIPQSALANIEEAVAEVNRRVGLVARYCAAPGFSPAGLVEVTNRMKPATPWKPAQRG